MGDSPEQPGRLPEEDIFTDVRDSRYETTFMKTPSSDPGLAGMVKRHVQEQTKQNGYWINEKMIVRICLRASKIIRYAQSELGHDIDFRKSPGKAFFKKMIEIAAVIEKEWEENHEDKDWRAKKKDEIDSVIKSIKDDDTSDYD